MIFVTAPIATVSETNQREHWGKRHRRRKGQRRGAYMILSQHQRPKPPLVVTLHRVSPHGLDDDNLRGALKAVRDGIADWLGMEDHDARIDWRYGQTCGRFIKEQAVRIEIQEKRDERI